MTDRRSALLRTLRAQLRDAQVLTRESRASLALFAGIVLLGALVFRFAYTFPCPDAAPCPVQHPDFGLALYASFALIFFETVLPYPGSWGLQVVFFLIPILGLTAVADGVLRFGSALMNKQARGQKWQVAMASTYRNHIIVCGMGKVGYRVTQELLKFGREVVGIEADPEGRFVEIVKAQGVPLLIANARRTEALDQAGVREADAIVPCTDDQLTNLDVALNAREANPSIKVVMRMYDSELARRVETGFGIHTAFSTSNLAAPSFAAAAMRFNVKYSFYVGDQLLVISEYCLPENSSLIGWTVEQLEDKYDLSVVRYQTSDLTDLHPEPEVQLEAGATLLLLADLETLRSLRPHLEP